jgi:N-acetylglutamate synthase-like GNAT family acetyltransferase
MNYKQNKTMILNYKPVVGYTPGIIGRITELHADFYSAQWDFGSFFEGKVATELSNFITNYNSDKDCIWSLCIQNTIEGSIAIQGASGKTAHLRWFIVSDKLRGTGAGNYLMKQAVSFCKKAYFEKVMLWTFEGLLSARHLYEKFGFTLVEEHPGEQWGTTVTEQRFELDLLKKDKRNSKAS